MCGFIRQAWFGRVALAMAVVMFVLSAAPRARAGFVPSAADAGAGHVVAGERGQDLETVRRVLESRKVAGRLADLGLSSAEARARLATLSDEELHHLAARLDSLTAGGTDGLVVALLLFMVVGLLVFYIADKRIVIH